MTRRTNSEAFFGDGVYPYVYIPSVSFRDERADCPVSETYYRCSGFSFEPAKTSLFFLKYCSRFSSIISDTEKKHPGEYLITIDKTCGENNSDFIDKKYKKLYDELKRDLEKDIEIGIKVTFVDKFGNELP